MIKKLKVFNVCGWLLFLASSPIQAADQPPYSDASPQPQTRGIWSSIKTVKTGAVWAVSSVWWGGWSTVAGIFRFIKRILPSRKVPKSPDVSAAPLVVVEGNPYNKDRLDLEVGKKTAPGNGSPGENAPKPVSGDDWDHVERTRSGSPASMMYFPDEGPKNKPEE